HHLWLSSHVYVTALLDKWNMLVCKSASTSFPYKITEVRLPPPNLLPEITDDELVPKYQQLVGCLLYLAISTHPDLSYYAMWLGQYNSKPTRFHFLAAKHVL
ncbi:hypothetical protein BYT27DRAFT_7031445, partial [Phlegmacium glaucopus]